ncbi:MAG: PIN domain-containing protein [Acidobacteria bacterium]|nr:PIN domain-containing protein [Acidobacteriota bacterium]
MSYSLDANVLLFASDRSSERHAAAREFLESCAASPKVLCVTWPTLMGYLRIATHPSIFSAPLTPEEALANVQAILALPQARVVSEQDDFMDAYLHVTADTVVRGNLVPDAHVASILFQNGVRTLYSNDRDFRKFETLDVRDPFA